MPAPLITWTIWLGPTAILLSRAALRACPCGPVKPKPMPSKLAVITAAGRAPCACCSTANPADGMGGGGGGIGGGGAGRCAFWGVGVICCGWITCSASSSSSSSSETPGDVPQPSFRWAQSGSWAAVSEPCNNVSGRETSCTAACATNTVPDFNSASTAGRESRKLQRQITIKTAAIAATAVNRNKNRISLLTKFPVPPILADRANR